MKVITILVGLVAFAVSAFTQNVVVNPTGNQNVVQPSGTSLNDNTFNNIRYAASSDNWSDTGVSLTGGSANTITLTPCPLGIDASGQGMYFIYIQQSTTTEITQVTGGTCLSGASSGTIVFTPKNSYTSATIGSASSGIQEAINDGCGITTSSGNCHIILPPGTFTIYGTVFQHCSDCLVDASGTQFISYTRDRAWMLGAASYVNRNVTLSGATMSSALTVDGCQITNMQLTGGVATITTSTCSAFVTGDTVTVNFVDSPNFWGEHVLTSVSGTTVKWSSGSSVCPSGCASPGTIAIQNAAIEDNAYPGTVDHFRINASGGGKYNQGIVANNDQSAHYDHLDYLSPGLLCDANHCGSYVYSAGTTSSTPVIWVSHANWNLQCAGNGLTNYANNSTRVSDSVIEGFGMWGVNSQNLLGSYGGTESDNVYMEEGSGPCVHPYEGSAFSATGFIWYGNLQPLVLQGGEQPAGTFPQFSCSGCSGTTQLNYYVVANDTTAGVHSFPLLAGYVLTNLSSGTVAGQFPHIPPQTPGDTVTYDILRMQPQIIANNTPSFPVFGSCTGSTSSQTACGSIVVGQAQCSGLVCTFTDNPSAYPSSYSINNNSWQPILPFWPAAILVTGAGPGGFSTAPVIASSEPPAVVSVNGTDFAQVFTHQCDFADNSGFSGGAWKQCLESGTNAAGEAATVMTDSPPGNPAGQIMQGRLNFTTGDPYNNFGMSAHHVITLVNSIPNTTLATITNRPPASANDTYIGIDHATGAGFSSAGLAFGAPYSISNYIGNVGDNASYLERLTSSSKLFNVPITASYQITSTVASGTAPFVVTSTTRVANLTTGGNPVSVLCGTSTTCSKTLQASAYLVHGLVTLSSGSATVSSLPFSGTTWTCTTSDNTTATNGSNMKEATATTGTVTGTGSDVISYQCAGN
jgi:hypothetical protein